MAIAGTILTVIGIIALVIGCVMSLKKMQKLQDMSFRQKNPEAYKKLKVDFTSYIIVGVGVIGFIAGFILMNFF